jgi:Swt1-like HEPN
MAVTNHERVGKGLELLKGGLAPFVDREFRSVYKDRAAVEAIRFMGEDRLNARRPLADWDAAPLLRLMWEAWNDVFRRTLGPAERSLLSELREHRNKWAHQQAFSGDDAYRALDSAGRLLAAVSAPQAAEIDKMKMELLRLRFDEQVRRSRARPPSGSSRGAKSRRRTATSRAGIISRPSSPPICGRCISARAPTSTETRASFSAALI